LSACRLCVVVEPSFSFILHCIAPLPLMMVAMNARSSRGQFPEPPSFFFTCTRAGRFFSFFGPSRISSSFSSCSATPPKTTTTTPSDDRRFDQLTHQPTDRSTWYDRRQHIQRIRGPINHRSSSGACANKANKVRFFDCNQARLV
jgi:hypothetical protein